MALQDDPRLTAYVLGELDAAERAEIDALLAQSPEAQAEVAAIEATVMALESELGQGAAVDPALRDAVLAPSTPSGSRAKWLWVSGLVAAAAAVGLFVVQRDGAHPRDGASLTGSAQHTEKKGAPASLWLRSEAPASAAPVSVVAHSVASAAPPAFRAPASAAPRSAAPASSAASRAAQERARRRRAMMRRLNKINTHLPGSRHADEDWPSQADIEPSRHGEIAIGRNAPTRPTVPLAQGKKALAAGEAIDQLVDQVNAGFYAGEGAGRDRHLAVPENPFQRPTDAPLSTFSIDVDTASYSMTRSHLRRHRLPPRGAVRIEELINYFEYDYAPPTGRHPFATHIDVTSAPWQPENRLVRIGLKGKQVDRARANLVFLLDVSGSMSARNKLPLLKRAMRTLVDTLRPDDRVAIVVYAGASGLVLESTPAKHKQAILGALDRLKSGGGTNGGAGIKQAYWVAAQHFIQGGINRVIIGTDGDFNVGATGHHALIQMVEERARGGIALTVLGFGMGNYNDMTLEQLADKGDGNYAYIDTFEEARKVLVDQLDGTLTTIAKDVKLQVEFNPAQVAAYRLIGYENRALAAQDFNDDTKDAGEIGAGHTVTALYEVVPTGRAPGVPAVDPLKYQPQRPAPPKSPELLTVKLRYQAPTGGRSTLIERPVVDQGGRFEEATDDMRFAASVAAFGMLLRGSPNAGDATLQAVLDWAEAALGKDEWGYRRGFLTLLRQAIQASNR